MTGSPSWASFSAMGIFSEWVVDSAAGSFVWYVACTVRGLSKAVKSVAVSSLVFTQLLHYLVYLSRFRLPEPRSSFRAYIRACSASLNSNYPVACPTASPTHPRAQRLDPEKIKIRRYGEWPALLVEVVIPQGKPRCVTREMPERPRPCSPSMFPVRVPRPYLPC